MQMKFRPFSYRNIYVKSQIFSALKYKLSQSHKGAGEVTHLPLAKLRLATAAVRTVYFDRKFQKFSFLWKDQFPREIMSHESPEQPLKALSFFYKIGLRHILWL